MNRDTISHEDIFNDLYITFGGLLSRKSVDFSEDKLRPKESEAWEKIKYFVLKAVNTHDEVSERQPLLIALFESLNLGKDIKPLKSEGDILLRDFIVEVKQPSFLKLASIEASTLEGNDQQLLRAMRFRKKSWGILTNGSEWQFVFENDVEHSGLFIPFVSFSVLDMIRDETIAAKQIKLLLGLLLSKDARKHLIRETLEHRSRRISGFANQLSKINAKAKQLGMSDSDLNELIKLIFRISFLFYCEDLGVLPRKERRYRPYDIRTDFKSKKTIEIKLLKKALSAFSEQKWSSEKSKENGNSEFYSSKIENWIDINSKIINQLGLNSLWFTENSEELDLSDISSSDLCDVYQHCVTYGSENVGTVYTSKGLSNFLNHTISENIKSPLEDGELILDPACGSGHLLKRVLFICERLVNPKKKFRNRQELVEYFCTTHLAGIDKNETAIFIAKLNLWLTCVSKEKSLPKLKRFETDNTLKRFENAFAKPERQLSEFLGELGSSVRVIVSNPPWSMIFGNHPEKWIASSEFWNGARNMTSKQDNTAFNFGYLSSKILSDKGVAILILPGSFFIGSSIRLRDYLLPRILCYAPVTRNTDFGTVDSSQNYGIIAFRNENRSENLKAYFGLNEGRLVSAVVSDRIYNWPKNRKNELKLPENSDFFETNSLLPLFASEADIEMISTLIDTTEGCLLWDKGGRRKPIKGEGIKNYAIDNAKAKIFACPENRGNSKKIVDLVGITRKTFDKCNEHVLRLDLTECDTQKLKMVMKFIESNMFNRTLSILRTTKSIRASTLNLMGIPKHGKVKADAVIAKIEALQKKVRKKTAYRRSS